MFEQQPEPNDERSQSDQNPQEGVISMSMTVEERADPRAYAYSDVIADHKARLISYLKERGSRVGLSEVRGEFAHSIKITDSQLSTLISQSMGERLIDIYGLSPELVLLESSD